jgi:hypothetical protein
MVFSSTALSSLSCASCADQNSRYYGQATRASLVLTGVKNTIKRQDM